MLRSLVREISRFRTRRRVRDAERRRLAGDARGALRRLPDLRDPDVLAVRGLALRDIGDARGAIAALEASTALRNTDAEVLNELGVLLLGEGENARARELFERAAALAPALGAPLANLGLIHLRALRPQSAVPLLERAVGLAPDELSHWLNLVSALRDANDLEGADSRLREAEARFAGDPAVEFRRATLEREMGETEKAKTRLEHLIRDDPSAGSRHMLLGMVKQDLGDYAGANECFDSILNRVPGHPHTRFLKGLLALLQGQFSVGWDDYEARFLTEESPDRGYPFPAWEGRPIEGGLLAYAEQGVGDELMFASCFPDAMTLCGRLVIQCDPRLARLFARSFPGATVVGAARTDSEWLADHPGIEAKVAAGSLPAHFRRDRSAFEGRTPYLKADPERVDFWRRRLESLGPGPYVGISWRGGIAKTRRAVRSIPVASWAPVLAVPAAWVSLQYDARDDEIAGLNERVRVDHWPEIFGDLDEEAALVCALDHIVSVCNATVHLAGALGRPATVVVPSAPEWRYGSSGESMAWYPSVTLLRQERGQAWEPVLEAASRRLAGRT